MGLLKLSLLSLVAIAYLQYASTDSCVQCNSSLDPKCATNPLDFMIKNCSTPNNSGNSAKCYVRVLNGNTIRGCAGDLDNATASTCHNEMECLLCGFIDGCNRQEFPLHRAQCLQCEGGYNSTCATDLLAKPTICPIYKLGDQCYIRNNGRNTTNSFKRGCLSTAQSNKQCVKAGNCYTCEGPGCNFLDANSNEIPIARDGAATFVASLALLVAGIFATRPFKI